MIGWWLLVALTFVVQAVAALAVLGGVVLGAVAAWRGTEHGSGPNGQPASAGPSWRDTEQGSGPAS